MECKEFKEILFRYTWATDKKFVNNVGPDGSMGKLTESMGVRLNTLLNLIDEMELWDEYTAWVAEHK